MKNKMILLIGSLTILLAGSIYWNFSSNNFKEKKVSTVTNSNDSEKKELNFKENKVSKKITNEENSLEKTKVLNYKDIFKEPGDVQTKVEKIVEYDELKKLDMDANELITEADTIIEKNNLLLEEEKLPKDIEVMHHMKVSELENKLNKLETE